MQNVGITSTAYFILIAGYPYPRGGIFFGGVELEPVVRDHLCKRNPPEMCLHLTTPIISCREIRHLPNITRSTSQQ